MTKEKSLIKTDKDVLPARTFSLEEAKKIAKESCLASVDFNLALEEFAKKQLPEFAKTSKQTEAMSSNMDKISLALSLETGHILVESIPTRYRGFALQLKKDLEKEFDCKTASEIALVDQAVNAHIRKLSYSKLMEGRNEPEWLSYERVAFLNYYSKEADRSHRQFISAIETLKFMKQPSLRVNIRTNNAFVGEKQQFNNNNEKINESK